MVTLMLPADVTLKTRLLWLPSTASWPAPGPAMVRFLSTLSWPPVRVMTPVTLNPIMLPLAAYLMASRRLQWVTLHAPSSTSLVEFTVRFGTVVLVGVAVGVRVGVRVAVRVGVCVAVLVGVFVAVAVGVLVGVPVGVAVAVLVGVVVGVAVGVAVSVGVFVGVAVSDSALRARV